MAKSSRLFVIWRNRDGSLYAFDDLGRIDLTENCDELKHDAYSADGDKDKAICRVRASALHTDLDYEAFETANIKADMHIGVARLTHGANGMLHLSWKDQGSTRYETEAGVVLRNAELKKLSIAFG